MNKNFRAGRIYSQEDWRDFRICFGKVDDCKAQLGSEPLDQNHLHVMPYELEIDNFEFKLLSSQSASAVVEAEALYLSFRFMVLEYSDSAMTE